MGRLILITGQTIEWLEGNHDALDIKIRHGCSVTVKCDRCRDVLLTALPDYDTWCRAEFCFSKRGAVVPYKIEIYSEDDSSILEIVDVLWDTTVESVIIHDCPSLMSMRFHNVNCFNFSGCPNLEYLDCDYYKGEILDLTALPLLKRLQCLSGEASIIELSKKLQVVSLNLCGCKMRTLKVGNTTKFKNLNIDDCNALKPQMRLWMGDKLIENGEGL